MAKSVNMDRGISSIVLQNFQKIALARKHLWTWSQITGALREDYPNAHDVSESAVQSAFKRIERGVNNRRIKPVVAKQPAENGKATANARRPLPGQAIPVGDGEAMVDAVEAKLGTNFFK